MAKSRTYDFIEWVKYIRKNIFTSSQQQFGKLLEHETMQNDGEELGDRYIGVLEGRASTIRIDVLEQMLKMMGVDFEAQIQFYEMAFAVARSAMRESKDIDLVDFLQMRYSLNTVREPDFIKCLEDNIKQYIYNLVDLNKNFYGTNKLVDMQSVNFFWTVAAVEYDIMRQGDIALSETTSNTIKDGLKDVLNPIVDACEKIFEQTADEGIAEGKNKFNEIRRLISDIDISFPAPKSKKEQLDYKVNLRTQRITKSGNWVLSNYLDKMLCLLKQISEKNASFLFACLTPWSKYVLNLMDSLNQLLQTGHTDNKDMNSGYKIAVNNNHIELIYNMSVQINMLEKGSDAIGYLEYLLPEYDEKIITYLCNNKSEKSAYPEWLNELTAILSDDEWQDKYAGAYAKLKMRIVDYLYMNNIPIQNI